MTCSHADKEARLAVVHTSTARTSSWSVKIDFALSTCKYKISTVEYFLHFSGRKLERSLSAKRKESIDSFIPIKPMMVKSKTLDRPPSKDSWDSQSKSLTF